MSRFAEPLPVEVNVGPCDCPGSPHQGGDVVYLAPALSMPGGMAAQGAIAHAGSDPIALQEALAKVWIRHAVIDWTFTDEDGDKVPLTEENIARALPYGKGGRLVAERADDLYAEDILAPLADRLRSLSRRGPTTASTSRTPRSRSRSPKSSSTATTDKAPPAG